jgi:hypothetical protein
MSVARGRATTPSYQFITSFVGRDEGSQIAAELILEVLYLVLPKRLSPQSTDVAHKR